MAFTDRCPPAGAFPALRRDLTKPRHRW